MTAIVPDSYRQILDNLPQVVMRLTYEAPATWRAAFVNKAVERYGYSTGDFVDGRMSWNDLLHPDDRVVALKLAGDYMKSGIDDFKLQYRVLTKDGASIYIVEYSHVNRTADGREITVDSLLFENLEASSGGAGADEAMRRQLALNDILLTIQDAKADPGKAIQYILDRAGAVLDCSRALLFEDSPDHKTCKVVYEWLNNGITSIKDLDYAVTYSTGMPEIYTALQSTGVLLVNAGEIPENCREEFEAEGLLASAIFAVYQYGDHYGFVCFDDCIVRRRWDDETANFLKVVANLLSNVVMNLQSVKYMEDYEEKIKSLAFRDYLTGLPNQYPYDSDFVDAVLAAGAAGTPGYAVVIGLDRLDAIRREHGLAVANSVCKKVSEALAAALRETLGERATLYRLGGAVFALLAQPGPAEPVRAFAERAARLCAAPWSVAAGEFSCSFSIAGLPFGLKNTDPARIGEFFDAGMVKGFPDGGSFVFLDDEPSA